MHPQRQAANLRPSPVFGMSAKQLSRWAFDVACARLERLPFEDRLAKFNALRGAYQLRQENIKQQRFVDRALGRRVADRLARELGCDPDAEAINERNAA